MTDFSRVPELALQKGRIRKLEGLLISMVIKRAMTLRPLNQSGSSVWKSLHGGPSQLVCLFHVNVFFTFHRYHHHLPPIREGRWGTTDDFTTSFAFTVAKLSSDIRAAAKEWCAEKCTLATANIDLQLQSYNPQRQSWLRFLSLWQQPQNNGSWVRLLLPFLLYTLSVVLCLLLVNHLLYLKLILTSVQTDLA